MLRVKVYRRKDGLYEWRMKAANGRIVATSAGQGYFSEAGAKRARDKFVADIELEGVEVEK